MVIIKKLKLKNVKEYYEEYDPELILYGKDICIKGINEGGYNSVAIDLPQLLEFLEKYKIIMLRKDYKRKLLSLFDDIEGEE